MKRRRLVLAGVVLLALTAACDSEPEEETQQHPTDPAVRTEAVVSACQDFFEGEPSLAERAEEGRDLLRGMTDDTPPPQIRELAQELDDLASNVDAEIASSLVGIGGIFSATVEADDEGGDLELDEGAIVRSEDSQEQFRETCESNGYDVP